jgi:hypothetical protein
MIHPAAYRQPGAEAPTEEVAWTTEQVTLCHHGSSPPSESILRIIIA